MTVYSDLWKEEMNERAEKELESVVVEERALKFSAYPETRKQMRTWESGGAICAPARNCLCYFQPPSHACLVSKAHELLSHWPVCTLGRFPSLEQAGNRRVEEHTPPQKHCCWWALLMRGHLVSIHEISKLSMGTSVLRLPSGLAKVNLSRLALLGISSFPQ